MKRKILNGAALALISLNLLYLFSFMPIIVGYPADGDILFIGFLIALCIVFSDTFRAKVQLNYSFFIVTAALLLVTNYMYMQEDRTLLGDPGIISPFFITVFLSVLYFITIFRVKGKLKLFPIGVLALILTST